MTESKFVRLHEEPLKKIEKLRAVLYKTSGQNVDDSKLIRIGVYMLLDKFQNEGIEGFSEEFKSDPVNYIKLQDSIHRMKKD